MSEKGNCETNRSESVLHKIINENSDLYRHELPFNQRRLCSCKPNHLSCITAKEWLKCQIGVWQFN